MSAEIYRIQEDVDAWVDHMRKFWHMCKKEENGFSSEDLTHVALSVCAPRQRIPQSAGGFGYMDMKNATEKRDRQRIIDSFYNRLVDEKSRRFRVSSQQASHLTSALSWALLQITNIDEMRKLEQTLDSVENVPEYFENIEAVLEGWDLHFKIFLTQPLSDDRKRLGEGEPLVLKTHRSKKVKELVAHIYPFSAATGRQTKATLKDTLARLWGADREKAMSEKLFPNGTTKGIDVIGNVICLSPSMHAAWSRYDFALFPLRPSEAGKEGPWTMRVVFYWLMRREVNTMSVMGSDMTTCAQEVLLRNHQKWVEEEPRAIDLRTNMPILSGRIFTIKAVKKDHLPDYDILMLLWDIARMASLCGAAEPDDDSDSDSSYYYDEMDVEAEVHKTSEEMKDVQL
ncbi:hypothetical protein ACHAQH_001724 [Verticillium albo-atrum]